MASYDPADNRTSVVYPGGTMVSYGYDALNQMNTVTEGGLVLADYDWDTLSRRDLVKLNANAFNMDLAYEADDDLLQLAHTGPAPLTFDFTRNNSGQITILTASNGNFLSRPVNTLATGYVPNRLNQYTSVGGTAYSHDANGNLTGDGAYSYEYDEENRLRTAVGAGNSASYEYDPLGRRRAKIVTGVINQTLRFASDNAEEIEERDGSNAVLRRYFYGSGIDERIAMTEVSTPANCPGGGRCFYLTNWQGSTTTLVNQNGSQNATYHYGPYGEGTNWSPADASTGNPFRYTGRRVDPETGLYYYRARYYSPKLGRFLQTDPIGNRDDLNLYAYVYNDPLNKNDPFGEQACNNQKDCVEATNFKPQKSDGQTVAQSANIDAAAVTELPKHESMGDTENAVRFDESASGNVTTTPVPTTSVVKGNVIESTISGIAGADAIGHSHPIDKSDPSPGPRDDVAVNAGLPNNIVHDRNVIVVEKVNGQFRVRVLNDNNLTKSERKEMQRDVNRFQRRIP